MNGSGKPKIAPQEVALLFYEIALSKSREMTDSFSKSLGCHVVLNPIEALIYAMFPFDMITCSGFGVHSSKVRASFRQCFITSQLARDPKIDLASLLNDRFEEYFLELNRQQTGFAGYGLMCLGNAASKRIMGVKTANAFVASQCSLYFTAALKAFGPLCDQYEIID